MYHIHKLKPNRDSSLFITHLAAVAAALLAGVLVGVEAASFALASFFGAYAVCSLLTYARTMNKGFIVVFLFQASAAGMLFTAATHDPVCNPLTGAFAVSTLFFLVWTAVLAVTRQIKWRGREVLELAAAPVEDVGDGYTTRPLPAGKTDFTPDQIMSFAAFAVRHLIAVAYVGREKVVLVPVSSGREFPFIVGLKGDYTDETWVSFGFDGRVTVNISHRDYLQYKEALSFEQLCSSLGDLFVGFLSAYCRGEGARIIDRLNALGISSLS